MFLPSFLETDVKHLTANGQCDNSGNFDLFSRNNASVRFVVRFLQT